MITLYKRNNKNVPIFWSIQDLGEVIKVHHGVVGHEGHIESFNTTRKSISDEIKSRVKAKRKEGYKALEDLYDNAPQFLASDILGDYLNRYLPKYNTTDSGFILPMLAKTLEDNKPFTKGHFSSQWKINGLRCIIGAEKDPLNLFNPIKLTYTSREGIRWDISWMDEELLAEIKPNLLEMMVEEGACLDGELYLPGYSVNDINSFVKNKNLEQHYKLQYWCYDIAIEGMSAIARSQCLYNGVRRNYVDFVSKEEHLNNKELLVILPSYDVLNINHAMEQRDKFINLGFEGLIMRNDDVDYAFGKRNSSMFKYKRKEDGLFTILDIVPEGRKRVNLGKFILKNDINDATFECTYNVPHAIQEEILANKSKYITGEYLCLVEFRERSGQLQVPFHAKVVKLIKKENL